MMKVATSKSTGNSRRTNIDQGYTTLNPTLLQNASFKGFLQAPPILWNASCNIVKLFGVHFAEEVHKKGAWENVLLGAPHPQGIRSEGCVPDPMGRVPMYHC